jgi:2,4-dienoyl-CoA reductase-like NADH-dependent reductase (Old Yellow Enzyme family)
VLLDITVPKSVFFKPMRVRDVDLRNRSVIAAMCQYSAEDGRITYADFG